MPLFSRPSTGKNGLLKRRWRPAAGLLEAMMNTITYKIKYFN
jgi:hypothetical protein